MNPSFARAVASPTRAVSMVDFFSHYSAFYQIVVIGGWVVGLMGGLLKITPSIFFIFRYVNKLNVLVTNQLSKVANVF